MSLHEGIANENPLSSSELFELIENESLTEITNRINNDSLISREYLDELLSSKNLFNQTPIDYSIILARFDIFKVLISKLTKFNEINQSGYSSIHYAVVWRRLDELKHIYQLGCDMHLKTKRLEDPLKMSLRYGYDDITNYLKWTNARDSLIDYMNDTRNLVNSIEKSQGRLTKDDKKLCESVCIERELWLKSNPDATIEDFRIKLEECQNMLDCIWKKMNDNPDEA